MALASCFMDFACFLAFFLASFLFMDWLFFFPVESILFCFFLSPTDMFCLAVTLAS